MTTGSLEVEVALAGVITFIVRQSSLSGVMISLTEFNMKLRVSAGIPGMFGAGDCCWVHEGP